MFLDGMVLFNETLYTFYFNETRVHFMLDIVLLRSRLKWHWEKSSNHDMAPFSLNGVSKNTEHMSCVCDEATPIKDYRDFEYSYSGSGEIYSPTKRRLILFTASAIARCPSRKEISSPFIKSKLNMVKIKRSTPVT